MCEITYSQLLFWWMVFTTVNSSKLWEDNYHIYQCDYSLSVRGVNTGHVVVATRMYAKRIKLDLCNRLGKWMGLHWTVIGNRTAISVLRDPSVIVHRKKIQVICILLCRADHSPVHEEYLFAHCFSVLCFGITARQKCVGLQLNSSCTKQSQGP